MLGLILGTAMVVQSPVEKVWLKYVNDLRAMKGVGPLNWDEPLANSARWEMTNRWFFHEGFYAQGPARYGFPVRQVPSNGLPATASTGLVNVYTNVSEGTGPSISGSIRDTVISFRDETIRPKLHWLDILNPYWDSIGIAYGPGYAGMAGQFILVYGRRAP